MWKSLRPVHVEQAHQRQVSLQAFLKPKQVTRGTPSFSPWLVETLALMRRSCGSRLP